MYVELMDLESANLIGCYATEDEALAIVRAAAQKYGRPYVYTWSLGFDDDDRPAIQGSALVDLAFRGVPA